MDKQWIDSLAQEIKQKNHDAAEKYGRDQHYAAVVATVGREFFISLTHCLQEDVDTLRHQLQGDLTASDMTVETVRADEIRIVRARFPWVDAAVMHHEDHIALDYAKGAGLQGDPKLDRKSHSYAFQVAPDDTLFIQDAFAEPPARYDKPEELARHIIELLFAV